MDFLDLRDRDNYSGSFHLHALSLLISGLQYGDLMLAQRRRRWANIKSTLDQCLRFALPVLRSGLIEWLGSIPLV